MLDRIKYLLRHPHPIKYVVAWVFIRRLGLASRFVIKRRDYALWLYPTALSGALWTDAEAFTSTEDFFRTYLRPGDLVIDVGANIGTLALTASAVVGELGTVVAVEAHPRTFQYLCGNVALNHRTNVVSHNVALGDRDGTIGFSDKRGDDFNAVVSEGEGIAVPLRRLDSLPLPDRQVALLKIDVEGYEKFVLDGAHETLQRTMCVLFEASNAHYGRYGYTVRQVVQLLASEGFEVFQVGTGEALTPIQADYAIQRLENLVAIREAAHFYERVGANPIHV